MLRPFKTELWLAIGLSLFILSVILSCTNSKKNTILNSLGASVINAVHLCLARHPLNTMFANRQSRLASGIQICALFLSVLITSLYTAKVVSVFVLKDELIKSPEDLLKHNYEMYSYSPLHMDRLFGNSHTRNVVETLVKPVVGLETIEKVVGKKYEDPRQALLTLADGFYPQALYGLGYTKEISLMSRFESTLKTPRCPYIRKNSPFRNEINIKILQFIERGLNHRLTQKHSRKFLYTCSFKTGNNLLSLNHTLVVNMTIAIGAVFAILIHCASKYCQLIR